MVAYVDPAGSVPKVKVSGLGSVTGLGSKTESRTGLRHIQLGSSAITPSSSVRNLGVIFDDQLTFKDHIAKTA